MRLAMNEIADVMQIAGNARQLHLGRRISERLQDIARDARNTASMPPAMLGVAKPCKLKICRVDEGGEFFVIFHRLQRHHGCILD